MSPEARRKLYKGILLIILSAFFFTLMNMFVKMSGDIPAIQKSFFRNSVAFLFALVMVLRSNVKIKLTGKSIKFLLARSFFGTLGIVFNFYSVDHMTLSDASMLNKMSPFFTILFSRIFLKERFTATQGVIVAVAFLGSLLVIKPTGGMSAFPAMIALLGGLTAGLAYTMVRKLGTLKVTGPFVVLFFSGFSSLATAPYMIFNYTSMTKTQVVLLLLAGLTAAGGQFSITAAYFNAPAKDISVYDYSQIIFAATLGFIVFSQIPDMFSWIGYFIIIAMAVLMFLYNKGKMNKELKRLQN